MTRPQRRVSAVVRANESHWCEVRGCSEHRHSLSRWCQRHHANYERNGDPQGASLRPSLWAPYRARIRDLYASNGSHPGLAFALQWVAKWMQQAEDQDSRHAWASEVARVKRHGASPLDVLTELAACWCYLQDQPRSSVSDSHRDWALSKAVLGLAPRPRRVTREAGLKGSSGYAQKAKPAALRYVGPHLVKALSRLLVNTRQSLQAEDERARAEVETMRQPFHPSQQALSRATNQLTEE